MNSARIYHGGSPARRTNSTAGGGGVDEKVKVDAFDTTPDFLLPKLAGVTNNHGDGVEYVVLNKFANEQVNITSKREVTLLFVNSQGDLQVNEAIPVPNTLPLNWCGYYIPFQGITFHTIFGLIHKYKTSAPSLINIRFRYYTTAQPSLVDQTGGTILGTDLPFNLPNTNNLFNYYWGAGKNLENWYCPGNNMLVPYCQSNASIRIDGINIVMRGTINLYSPS